MLPAEGLKEILDPGWDFENFLGMDRVRRDDTRTTSRENFLVVDFLPTVAVQFFSGHEFQIVKSAGSKSCIARIRTHPARAGCDCKPAAA